MSRSPISHRTVRRTGQALLLAVLVMVFAALIGVTFITVVATNISQTGREEERDKARQAAEAGLALANLQLTNGVQGTKWRPEGEVKFNTGPNDFGPPAATDVFYWTPFDKAQGWAGTGNVNPVTNQLEGNFVKFPDPRSTNPTLDAPSYMVKVEKVGTDPIKDADNADRDKTGMVRITSIGLSPDDPTTFYRVVAYKAGPAQSPLTGAMRSVSNWDFQNDTVPSALTANAGSTSTTGVTTMTLAGLQGQFANKTNFYITISDMAGGNVRYAVVSSADAAGTTLTLAPTPTTALPVSSPPAPALTWAAGERVEMAAGLGAPAALDFNNSGTVDPLDDRVNFRVSTATTPGSAIINGGLILTGNSFLQNLRAPRQTSALTPNPGRIQVSGLIAVNSTSTPVVAGVLADGTNTGDRTLVSSSTAGFPFNGTETLPQKLSMVQDGSNRIANSPDPTRQVKPFTPPDITQGGDGFGRYRQLTKYSQPSTSGDPEQAGAYGYGQGIYINNPQDKEKLGAPVVASRREMTQAELESLWFDHTAPANTDATLAHLRAGAPRPATDDTVSLEQQHLRGWIAPDEFLPRGVLIEINPDATLTITLDSIQDGAAAIPGASERFNVGPVPEKGWRDENGNLINGNLGGVYRRANIAWPANGVIFAEGNVRIRGKATTNPPRNLTVVTLNNLYIEDSLGAGDKKIILLARRNAVVNPTRVLGRPQAQTRAGVGSSGANIVVRNGSLFRIGDRIQIGNGATYRRVTGISNDTLTLNTAPGTPPVDGTTVIRLQTDPVNSATPARPFFSAQTPYLGAETQAMQRRFWMEGTNTEVRIAMRHGGAESPAISVQTTGTPPPLNLGNKLGDSPAATTPPVQIVQGEKILTVEGDGKSPYPDDAATDTIDDLITELNNSNTVLADGFAYNASVIGGYGITPYRYLAGVGLRYKIDPDTAPTAFPWREDVSTGAKEFTMATSVRVSANAGEAVLFEDSTGVALGVNQFGFSPSIGDIEDPLTVDRSFYTPFTNSALGTNPLFAFLTTDSRRIANLLPNNLNTLTWRFHETVAGAGSPEDGLFSETGSRRLPYYGLSRVKLENLNQYTGSVFENLDTGYALDINAYVYAQEGSWFVIPGVHFDERLKTSPTGVSFVDLNNNYNNPVGSNLEPDAGENLDFNRDGVVSRDEQVGVYRFLRYNYSIKFTGAIMENKTAIVEDPDGTGPLRGHVADWTDKWAAIRTSAANFVGAGPGDVFNPGTMTTANGNFATIEYNFDPAAAVETLVTDEGFHPPVTPELIYQTG